jgi:AbiV family abortive infection protein
MIKGKLSIPLSNIHEGIELCLKNATQFSLDAQALCKISSYNHALGLCLYAIEELGKACLLKELFLLAKKHGYKELTLDHMKTTEFFNPVYHQDLDKLGFRKNTHPFFDHRLKLLYGRSLFYLATQNRLLGSLSNEKFGNFKKLLDAFDKKGKESYGLEIKQIGFRELLMYVDFDQEKNEWINGIPKISEVNLTDIVDDIEKAIQLFRQEPIKD